MKKGPLGHPTTDRKGRLIYGREGESRRALQTTKEEKEEEVMLLIGVEFI